MQQLNKSRLNTLRALRKGFTVTELLVCIGIIGLLAAILLPAIQQSRVVSRSLVCKNNLHQIGVAAHSFHSQHGYLDVTTPLRKMLPFIEQTVLLTALDSPPAGGLVPRSPPVYVCPDDPELNISNMDVSYLVSAGTDIVPKSDGTGIYAYGERRFFKEVTDGLSGTVMFAEHLVFLRQTSPITLEQGRQKPLNVYWESPRQFQKGQQTELAETFMDTNTRATAQVEQGRPIQDITVSNPTIFFNHLVTPNNWSFTYICENQSWYSIPATSGHVGGVNVLIADGSTRFVASRIDLRAWWAMGTIGSGDHTSF